VLCALCAVRACASLMLYVCVSGGTLCVMGIVCVRVCGPVRVNGILTEDPPSHVSDRVLVCARNERVSNRPPVWANYISYMRTHCTLHLTHEPTTEQLKILSTLRAARAACRPAYDARLPPPPGIDWLAQRHIFLMPLLCSRTARPPDAAD